MYGKNRVILRTIRPVLGARPWGLADRQALPPRAWCFRCGGEVYTPGRGLCLRCLEEGRGHGG